MRNDQQIAAEKAHPVAEADDSAPGVPGFRSWNGVYLFVFACFVLTVTALAIFTRVFS